MPIPKIQGSVGVKGANARQDVRTVQQLINGSLRFMSGSSKLVEDGLVGPKTISAIEAFQKQVVRLTKPDAKVDPGKTTLEQMWVHSIAGRVMSGGVFRLEIRRKRCSTKSIIGDLLIGTEVICNTLELPWNWNRKDVSCIPFGEYNGALRTDGNRGWRIQLNGVPGRTVVQIHVGNYPKQIEGCILVGMGAGTDAVWNSADALRLLRVIFNKSGKPSIKIRITGVIQLPAEMVPPPGALGSKQQWA